MARYDRGFGGPRGGWRGQGGGMGGYGGHPGGFGPPRRPGGYSGGEWNREQSAPGRPLERGVFGGPGHRGAGGYGAGGPGGGWSSRGPRGEYGGAYEEYGGYPGGPVRGEYYGGRGGRPSQGRVYDGPWEGGGGFAREPFIPDEAYRRHPEYRQHRQPREWEAHQSELGGEEMDDTEVREAVYRRMAGDAWLDPERIGVQVEDGVVTLTGEVDDYMEARYAWDDAWEAEGVRGVINNLTVRADQPQTPHGDVVVQGAGDQTTLDEASGSPAPDLHA